MNDNVFRFVKKIDLSQDLLYFSDAKKTHTSCVTFIFMIETYLRIKFLFHGENHNNSRLRL